MTGNKSRRGLADFLSRELKTPRAPTSEDTPNDEPRKAVTDRVSEAKAPKEANSVGARDAPTTTVLGGGVSGTVVSRGATAPSRVSDSGSRDVGESGALAVQESVGSFPIPAMVTPTKFEALEVTGSTIEDPSSDVAKTQGNTEVRKFHTSRVNARGAEPSEPLYLRLTRKEVRFRDEQLEGLHRLARRLSRARRGMKGDRITDNTLVRVAVDLLLQHADDLTGYDEVTLLESLRRLCRKRG